MKNITENTKALQNIKAEAVAKALRENLRKRKKQKTYRKEEQEISITSNIDKNVNQEKA